MTDKDENIIKALGIQSLPDEQKARILDQSATMVEQRLLLRLMKSLTDAKRDQLNKILTTEDRAQLDEFIAQEAPNFGEWVLEETTAIRDELKSLSNEDI